MTAIRGRTGLATLRQRLETDERGEIGGSLVWAAGIALAAIAVVGILYTVFTSGAENISVDPGVG